MFDQRASLDDAGIVNGVIKNLVQSLGGQGNFAAVGQDRTAVLDARIHPVAVGPENGLFHAFVDRDGDQAPVVHGNGHLLAGSQDNVPDLGVDAADGERSGVLHGLRKERDIAAGLRRDLAGVLDKPVNRAVLEEFVLAVRGVREIVIVHLQGRCNERGGVDLRGRAKDDAVRVHEKDAAVRVDRAVDGGNCRAGDGVENAAKRRLGDIKIKIDREAGGDGKIGPFNDGFLRGNVDVAGIRDRTVERNIAGNDFFAGRQIDSGRRLSGV